MNLDNGENFDDMGRIDTYTRGFMNITSIVIEELFTYSHLAFFDDPETASSDDIEKYMGRIIMTILIIIFSATILKMLIIFIYFFIINTFLSMIRFFMKLYKHKCCVNMFQECKFICDYFSKILKKFYTYNFYSFENKFFGTMIVTLYITFLLFNIAFSVNDFILLETGGIEYEKYNSLEIKNKSFSFQFFHLLRYELQLFMECICGTIYLFPSFRKQYYFIIPLFVGLNFLIFGFSFIFESFELMDHHWSLRALHMIFLSIFICLYAYSWYKILKYNLSCTIKFHK
jgi:hypothetical protein